MTGIQSSITRDTACTANTLLVLSVEDLNNFANRLVAETRRVVMEACQSPYYSVEEAANVLHVAPGTVYNYIKKYNLTKETIGGRTLLLKEEVNAAMRAGTLRRYAHK